MQDILLKIQEYIDKYNQTKNTTFIEKIFEELNDTTIEEETLLKILPLKINNKTILEILIKKNYFFTTSILEKIIDNEELYKVLIKVNDKRIIEYLPESAFYKKINEKTLLEQLIESGEISQQKLYDIKDPMVIDLLIKYKKEKLFIYLNDELLLNKIDENTTILDYLFQNNLITDFTIGSIEKKEIIDYIIKYNKKELLGYISHKLMEEEYNGKLIAELLMENNIKPQFIHIEKKETVSMLLQNNMYKELTNVDVNLAFEQVPNTNKTLFELLLEKGYVCKCIFKEILKETQYTKQIIDLLKKYNKLEIFNNVQEEILIRQVEPNKTLLELLLENNINISGTYSYSYDSSFDALVKYEKYDELAKCSENLLLRELPNGKKLIEELLERNIEISLSEINTYELAKIIFDNKAINLYTKLSHTLLDRNYTINESFLDVILRELTETYRTSEIKNIRAYTATQIAKVCMCLLKEGQLSYIPTEELIKEVNGTTLLDELLRIDKKFIEEKLDFSNEELLNPKITTILRMHRMKNFWIRHDSLTPNLADIYTENIVKENNENEITKEHEEILARFFNIMNDGKSDVRLLEVLVSSYRKLMAQNSPSAKEIYHLIKIKENNPQFCIVRTTTTSYYCPDSLEVCVNSDQLDTLHHEIGHLFFHKLAQEQVPEDFVDIIKMKKFNTNTLIVASGISMVYKGIKRKITKKVKRELMSEYDKSLTEEKKEEIRRYLNSKKEEIKQKYLNLGYTEETIDEILGRTYELEEYIEQDRMIKCSELVDAIIRDTYQPLVASSDTYDGIFEGRLHDGKLLVALGSNYGHGVKYYKGNTELKFNELVANFAAVSKKGKRSKMIFSFIIGFELYDLIEKYYEKNILNSQVYEQNMSR